MPQKKIKVASKGAKKAKPAAKSAQKVMLKGAKVLKKLLVKKDNKNMKSKPATSSKKETAKVTKPTKAVEKQNSKDLKKLEAKEAKKAQPKKAKGQDLNEGVQEKPSKSRKKNALLLNSHLTLETSSVCREVACELMATTNDYCRLHYIKNWKKIKRKEAILRENKLNHYIEELVSKYPDKYIDAIRQDLASEKEFAKVISDLEIEENIDDFEMDSENTENLIDHIKRDFDDEGDVF